MDPVAASPQTPHTRRVARLTWLAGTRGEVLTLGPAYQALGGKPDPARNLLSWMLQTGENGMAAYQALDFLRLIPSEMAPLCHPADEPAIRLNLMIERAEAFVRQHKGTHAVFAGSGPTAAASAIYCHARGCRGLWLRPYDPAGLIPRLRWESGLERIIRACAPCVQTWQVPGVPDWFTLPALAEQAFAGSLENEIPGLRPDAPLVIIAVLRRNWGYLDDTTSRLARAVALWAGAIPEADFLIISNLNARLEGPVRSIKDRPANMLATAPLPYPTYRRLLERTRLVVTDSPMIAAEALERGLPIGSLGDLPPDEEMPFSPLNLPLRPEDLLSEAWVEHLRDVLEKKEAEAKPATSEEMQAAPSVLRQIQEAIEAWLQEEAE